MRLTTRDLKLLTLLTWQVRLATLDQLEAFEESAARRLGGLSADGLLRNASMTVTVIDPVGPLFRWVPGGQLPNFSALAYQLAKRRSDDQRRNHRIVWATAKAVRYVGGVGGRVRQPLQVEHDLAVTQVFLRRRELDCEETAQWLGEDCYRHLHRPKGKVPDSVLCDATGNVIMAIEFGGAYSAKRLRQFHRHCEQRRLPYEIW